MRSKTSFFDRGLCLNYLKRCWPLWTSWLALLLIKLPARIPGFLAMRSADANYIVQTIDRHLLQSGADVSVMAFLAAVAVAMAMYSFLYNSRSCSMINSLPLRRETVFFTAFLTGLVPMLIAELITAGITAVMIRGIEGVNAAHLWTYLGCAVLSTVAFYGMATLCAMLTGSLIVLPAVYLLLNVTATVAESAICAALSQFVYGFSRSSSVLLPASPFAWIADKLMVRGVEVEVAESLDGPTAVWSTGIVEYTLDGFNMLWVYCAAGLLLAGLALALYKRRSMERVGDVVAIPVLRPIFKYALSLGGAFCFTAVLFDPLFGGITYGSAEALAVLALLLAGAFLGYFAAEMLLQKTLRVFRGKWKGFIVTAAVLVLFVAVWETDLTGYERRIPDADELERVDISYYELTALYQPENIALTRDYHRQVLEAKDENESAGLWESVTLEYTLKNGRVISRYYKIADTRDQHVDPESNINVLGQLVNVQEAIDHRAATDVPVTAENVINAYMDFQWMDENGEYTGTSVTLSGEEMAEFYNDCLLPDSKDGRMCRIWPVRNEEYYATVSNVTLGFSLMDMDKLSAKNPHTSYYYDFTVYMDAERCCEWIREHMELPFMSLGEALPQQMNDDIEYYRITHN